MDIAKPMELTKNRSMELWNYYGIIKTGLIYNTSARHERHECDTSAIRATECDTIATLVRHGGHDCKTSEKF